MEEPKCKIFGCKGTPIIHDQNTGEVICGACGCVLDERTNDNGHHFSEDLTDYVANSRSGMKQSLQMIDSLSTTMSERDSFGKKLTTPMKKMYEKIKMLETRSNRQNNDRTMKNMLVTLNSAKTKLNLPESVSENAAYLIRKVAKNDLIRGRAAVTMILACIYISCRQGGVIRSMDEIAEINNVKKKNIFTAISIICENFDIALEPASAIDYVSKIASQMNINEKIQREAMALIRKLEESVYSTGKNPIALAATCLYYSCKKNEYQIAQIDLATAAGVTPVTLRNRMQEIKEFLQEF